MPRKKQSSKRPSLWLPVLASLLILLGYFYYSAYNFGTGPFMVFAEPLGINLLVEDTGNGKIMTQTQGQAKNNTGARITDTRTGKSVRIINRGKKSKNKADNLYKAIVSETYDANSRIDVNSAVDAAKCEGLMNEDGFGVLCDKRITDPTSSITVKKAKEDCLAKKAQGQHLDWSDKSGCYSVDLKQFVDKYKFAIDFCNKNVKHLTTTVTKTAKDSLTCEQIWPKTNGDKANPDEKAGYFNCLYGPEGVYTLYQKCYDEQMAR